MNRQYSRRSVTPSMRMSTDDSMTRFGVELSRPCAAQHVPQHPERLVDEHQAKGFHRVEVPVERGGHDACLAGDLTQAQLREAAVLQQPQRSGHDRAPGGLLALFARRGVP